jgi:hypothetical protein
MSALGEDAAQAFVSAYAVTNDLHRVGDWRGQRVGVGDALMRSMTIVHVADQDEEEAGE